MCAGCCSVCARRAERPNATGAPCPPRTASGHPDLQGIWQVLNTAAWDIQDLPRRSAPTGKGACRSACVFIVVSCARKSGRTSRAKLDPARSLLSGVAAHRIHAVSVSNRGSPNGSTSLESQHLLRHLHERQSASEGPIEWWMGVHGGGREYPRGGRSISRRRRGSTGRGTFTAKSCTWWALYAHSPNHMLCEVTIEDPKVFTRPWKMSMPLYRRVESDAEMLEYECYAYLIEENWPNK